MLFFTIRNDHVRFDIYETKEFFEIGSYSQGFQYSVSWAKESPSDSFNSMIKSHEDV